MLVYLSMIEDDRDRSKFTEIYEAYHDLMYHIAYKYLGNEQDAEDVVHHVFVKIAEKIKIIEPVSPKTKGLVVLMVENRIKDIYKVRSRHPEVTHLDERYITAQPPETNILLRDCIESLPDVQRHVIYLRYFEGYDMHQISRILGISLDWAHKAHKRAKDKLKQMYTEGEDTNAD